jgi:hypothetical protein
MKLLVFLLFAFTTKNHFNRSFAYFAQFGHPFRYIPGHRNGAFRPGAIGAKRRWSFSH